MEMREAKVDTARKAGQQDNAERRAPVEKEPNRESAAKPGAAAPVKRDAHAGPFNAERWVTRPCPPF